MKEKSRLKKVAIRLLFSLCIFVGFGEIACRLAYPKILCYSTEMWRYAMEVKQLRDNPDSPFVHRPNARNHLYGVDFNTNASGGRDEKDWGEKEEKTCRIAFVGDSITVGWGVAFEDIFSEGVERDLNKAQPSAAYTAYEAVNLGIGNYNSIMEYTLFAEKRKELKPDIVVVAYYINDAQPTPVPRLNFVKKNSYLWSFMTELKTRIQARFLKPQFKDGYNSFYKPESAGLKKTVEALQGFVKLAKEDDFQLVVFVIPELHSFKDYPFQHVTDFVRETVQSADPEGAVPVIDLLSDYQGHLRGDKDDPNSKDRPAHELWVTMEDHHPNKEGHAIAARRITAELTKLLKKGPE